MQKTLNFFKKFSSQIALLVIIFIIMGGAFWQDGGILLLDYIAMPHWNMNFFQNGWFLIPQIPVDIFGFEWGTKLSFFFILFLSAYLGVLFARFIAQQFDLSYIRILEFFGGLFLIINPFSYERMMVQPVIYLGIILLGYSLYFLFSKSGMKKWILASITAGIAFNLFLHASFMIVLIFGLYIAFFVRDKSEIKGILLSGVIIFLINANWILPPFFGIANSTSSIGTFNIANFEAFITQSLAPMNVWLTNLMLYGFWGERYFNHYANVEFLSFLWFVAGFVILILVFFGFFKIFQKITTRKYFYFFLILGFFSLIFGIGIASPLLRDFTLWMAENIPFWQGYREPQKWIGLLIFVELFGFLVALGYFLKNFGKDIVVRISIIIAVLLLIYTWSPGPLFGYHGQLRNTIYPQEFEHTRQNLLSENNSSQILALPWHSYIGCSWMGRPTVSNPISGLMSPLRIVSSNNIEVAGILYSNNSDPQTLAIENFLKNHNFETIANYDFSHILLMKQCASSNLFDWLDEVPQCQKIEDNEILSLYKCN